MQPFHAHAHLTEPGVELVVGGDGLGALVAQADLQVVLQVLADARQLVHQRNAHALEQRARPDARELQQLRRLDGAGAQQHLGTAARGLQHAALPVADAGGAAPFEHQLAGQRLGLDAQVGPLLHGRRQVGLGGAAAPALVRGELVVAGAFLRGAVEVAGARHADLLRAVDEGLDQLVLRGNVRNLQRSAAAVEGVGAALVALGLDEVGQHVVVAPAGVAQRGPMVVVLALAADVDEAVDRAGAAQRLAARPVDAPAVHVGVGVGLEAPVIGGAPHRLAVADGQVNPQRPIGRAGFEQQHARGRVFAQARRQHAAGGTGADDDVVERFIRHATRSLGSGTIARLGRILGQ
jgi:hypothetical protein